jgi:CubicO group peptidase (beta-lactamase class C family)
VILALADEGLVDMDRPVAEYLDWGDYRPGVTLGNILSMMSGIPGISGSASWPFPCRDDPSTTLQDCAKEVLQDETRSISPGEEFRYSGPAWQIPGAVAEIVTGRSWAELVQQKLAWPCGLTTTGFWNRGGGGYPSDFNGDPGSLPHTDNPSLGGGAYTTVNDYSKVLLIHLHGGLCGNVRVLSESSVAAMQEDLVPEGVAMPLWALGAVNYGMGWWKWGNEPNLLTDPGAFGAQAYLDPVEGWGAIVILEAGSNGAEALLRATLVPAIRSVLAEAAQ